jgi:hypothetical protein
MCETFTETFATEIETKLLDILLHQYLAKVNRRYFHDIEGDK